MASSSASSSLGMHEPEDEGIVVVNNIGSTIQHSITSQKTESQKLGSNIAVQHSSNKPIGEVLKFNSR